MEVEGPVLDAAWTYTGIFFGVGVIPWICHMMGSVIQRSANMRGPLVAVAGLAAVHSLGSGTILQTYGVAGAAGMIIFDITGLVVLTTFLARRAAPVRLTWGPIDWLCVHQLLEPGLMAATQSFVTRVTGLALVGFTAPYGALVLAGYGLGARIDLLMIPRIFGVGGAAIVLSGAATGAGLQRRTIRVARTTAVIAAGVVSGAGCVLAATAPL